MINLKYASEDLKKAAYLKGVMVGENKSWFGTIAHHRFHPDHHALFSIGAYLVAPLHITANDIEFVADLTWDEIKEGF